MCSLIIACAKVAPRIVGQYISGNALQAKQGSFLKLVPAANSLQVTRDRGIRVGDYVGERQQSICALSQMRPPLSRESCAMLATSGWYSVQIRVGIKTTEGVVKAPQGHYLPFRRHFYHNRIISIKDLQWLVPATTDSRPRTVWVSFRSDRDSAYQEAILQNCQKPSVMKRNP